MSYSEVIDPTKVEKMQERIIDLESKNLKTSSYSKGEMVKKIKEIIKEEADKQC